MKLLSLDVFYLITGLFFLAVALRTFADRHHPRRWGSGLFWGVLAVVFMAGPMISPTIVGYLVVVLVILAATGQVRAATKIGAAPAERSAESARLQNKLFWPALLVPATAVLCTLLLSRVQWQDFWLFDPVNLTVTSVSLGAVVAAVAAVRITGSRPLAPVAEGDRLLQTVGWALLLPQLLAALGGIFASAGVGAVVADLVAHSLPMHFPFVAVVAYCVGMALFTVCLGNAFAAFPVITLGIGLPFIVQMHHGNAAIMAAIGMLSGYCGTLLTPMAANFNIVPTLLLDLKDRNAVIKAQAPIGLAILTANILIMSLTVYRF